jgi:hypothetical protein
MYWIYLVIFIFIILTPKLISGGWLFLHEQDIESLLIFCFGTFGFILYLAKEKTLLRVFREKLHLQKQTNMITRDLSDSYSYIGEMNRKLDIVQELIFQLPKTTANVFAQKKENIYDSILQTVSLLSKTDQVTLCFVDTRKKVIAQVYQKNNGTSLAVSMYPEKLLTSGKFFWEEAEQVIVRSPSQAKNIAAFLVFSKTKNHIEDEDVFKILVSEALLLYCMKERIGVDGKL